MNKKKPRLRISVFMVCAIAVTVAAAVSLCVAISLSVYNRALMQNSETASEQAVQQTAVAVGNYLGDLKLKLSRISTEISESRTIDEFSDSIAAAARLQRDIESILVYDKNGELLAYGAEDGILKEKNSVNLSFDKTLFEEAEEYAVTPPHVQTLFEGRYPWVVTIAHKQEQKLFNGEVYIAIDFRFSSVAKQIDNVGIGQHGYCYLTDTAGNIIYHPQQQLIFSGLKTEDTSFVPSSADGTQHRDGVLYTVNSLPDSSWRIVGISYIDELITAQTEEMLWGVALSVICCAGVAALISQLFSRIVLRPVRGLVNAMKEFEKNAAGYRYTAPAEKVAELQTLSDSFEHMVGMIQSLMERVRREEITLRKTELKALQAQINPHFLYNTLDSIQWMCEQGENEDAVRMVGALAKLFRISISHGNELITIRDEVKHAQNYLIIQSFRYKNQFTYSFYVDPEIEDCLCNKITIQPLIENAIYHGLDRMVDEGKITVTVKPDGEDILIAVADNGVGMTEEQCRKILQKERSDSTGIGVKNVNDRLKIHFGERYGISIESELDVGTTVTVRIPQLRKEPENEI